MLNQGKQSWHERSPCSPPSPWHISCGKPSSSHHTYLESLPSKSLTNGSTGAKSGLVWKASIIAFRSMWSKAPTTVNGEQLLPWIKLHQRPDNACDAICSCSSGKRVLERHANSLERHLPAKSVARNDPSDAPPLSFTNAVMAPMANASATSLRRSAQLKCSAASMIKWVASSSSSITLQCSFASPTLLLNLWVRCGGCLRASPGPTRTGGEANTC